MNTQASQIFLGDPKPITQEELAYVQFWKASQGLQSKRSIYNVIRDTGNMRLPDFKSQCVTMEYLEALLLKRNFCITHDQAKVCRDDVNITAELLYLEIYDYLVNSNISFNLGFNQYRLPDKKWLLLVLYSINPQSDIFKKNFDPALVNPVPILVTGEIEGDAIFKTAKHPGFAKYLYAKQAKRQIKKDLFSKHWNEVADKNIVMVQRLHKRLNKLAPNTTAQNNNSATLSSVQRGIEGLKLDAQIADSTANTEQLKISEFQVMPRKKKIKTEISKQE